MIRLSNHNYSIRGINASLRSKVIDIKNLLNSEKWLKDKLCKMVENALQINSLESEIQIGNKLNILTNGGYQVKKCLLKARKKILEESIDIIGTHQCVCSKENISEKLHLKDFAVKSATIVWYLAILFLVDSILFSNNSRRQELS